MKNLEFLFLYILANSKQIWDTLDSVNQTYLWSILLAVYNDLKQS